MMGLPVYQVDAFAERPFAGNPAAVVLLDEDAGARAEGEVGVDWMRRVAAEMNLSETAFVSPGASGAGGAYGLRWFTPAAEVELCGHATLASAHVLWELGLVRRGDAIRFRTERSGELRCVWADGRIEMDFPADAPEPVEAPAGLAGALGARPVGVHRGRYDYLCELTSADAVRAVRPDWAALGRCTATVNPSGFDVRGVIVTAGSDREDFDFISRFFAPSHRIDEDPVTGSAHCVLGPF